jgi:hypothetical protein
MQQQGKLKALNQQQALMYDLYCMGPLRCRTGTSNHTGGELPT